MLHQIPEPRPWPVNDADLVNEYLANHCVAKGQSYEYKLAFTLGHSGLMKLHSCNLCYGRFPVGL